MLFIGRDASLGVVVLIGTVVSFAYFAIWLVGLPFVPENHFLRNFFPDMVYGLTIPLAVTTVIISILACYLAKLLEMKMRPLVVGLGGATNSGKTTLTQKLLRQFRSAVSIAQDDYFKEESSNLPRVTGLDHVNWDCIEALDMDTMMTDVSRLISDLSTRNSRCVLVIEGFLILNYKPLSELLDLKYFIRINKETCRKRRERRVYNPPDSPGYFDLCVWPMYETYHAQLEKQPRESNIAFLCGEENQEKLLLQVVGDIAAKIKEL